MSFYDFVFFSLIVGLPTLVSLKLFVNAPTGRPFVVTFALAIVGSLFLFWLVSIALVILGIGGLGMFDGIFLLATSPLIALITGLIIRQRRSRNMSSL